MNLWYCHLLITTLMNKKLPEGRLIGYDGSGWTVRAWVCVVGVVGEGVSGRQAGRQADRVLIFHYHNYLSLLLFICRPSRGP